MIKITLGERLDNQLIEYLDGIEQGIKMLSTSPLFGLISLNQIQVEEKIAFDGELEIGYGVIEQLPFLIFKFGNVLSFDSAIFNMEAVDKEENALNLILIENMNYTVVGTRLLGLNPQIIESLLNDIKNIPYDNKTFIKKGMHIQSRYEILELFDMCTIKQKFSKI